MQGRQQHCRWIYVKKVGAKGRYEHQQASADKSMRNKRMPLGLLDIFTPSSKALHQLKPEKNNRASSNSNVKGRGLLAHIIIDLRKDSHKN